MPGETTINPGTPSRSAQGIAYHEDLARGWNDRYARGGFKRRAAFFCRSVLPLIVCRGDWIDVGCGGGFFARILAERGARVLGIDGSAAMIGTARASVPSGLSQALRYEVSAIEAFGGRDARYDGAICLSMLEYVDDPTAIVAALAAMLKPGGVLVLSVPNRYSVLRGAQAILRRLAGVFGFETFVYLERSERRWTRSALAALAASHGLHAETVMGFDPVMPRFAWSLLPPSLLFLVCRARDP